MNKGFAMLGIGKTGFIEKPIPECGPMDAILKPLALAPCTSDIHTVFAGAIGERSDMFLGHEGVGEVRQVGSMVKDFKPGDRVIIPAITPEWGSKAAQEGFPMHSGKMLGGWKFSNTKDGVFCSHIHVNEADANLAHLPEGISPEIGCMLSDMMTTGFHGAELADIQYGDKVCVIGIGPVGLMSIAGCKLKGASQIYAVGSRKKCCEIATAYGATHIINYKNADIVDQVLELTNGEGCDKVVIAGGDNHSFAQAIRMIKAGGIIGSVNYLGDGDSIDIPRLDWGVGMSHKHIHGGLTPGGRNRMERLASLITAGKIDPSLLITHRLKGFKNIETALMMMKDKNDDLIKPVVTVDDID